MNIHVAISDQFLKAYNALPATERHRVSQFIQKFKRDPKSPGINFEVIQGAPDSRLRSVRINDHYRAIVLQPEQGKLYALLWVDKHDPAYRWACQRRAEIHPETGSLQILITTETVQAALPAPLAGAGISHTPRLFLRHKDKDLLRLGVPEALLPVVRHLQSEADLETALPYFPEEAAEALMGLAAGFSFEEIYAQQLNAREALAAQLSAQGEPDDETESDALEQAFRQPDTLRRFVILTDDQALETLLDKPLETWRVFLHPSQRQIVQTRVQGAIRVLGGAGTGKTVVLMHRARWLAEQLASPNDRILLTTFTRNLAADIQAQLASLCSPELLRRIEVINLDAWVQNHLGRQGHPFQLIYQGKSNRDKADICWAQALEKQPDELGLTEAFYAAEWAGVIAAQGITDLRGYFRASRVGRGTALDRSSRQKIWPVFETYRLLLKAQGLREVDDAYRELREMLARTPGLLPYCHILVDETQDMGEQALKLLRQMVPAGPNDLFLAGDAHQRIYARKVVLKNCGIQVQGRNHAFRLKLNYRTTDEIRRWAVSLLQHCAIDDLDDGPDSSQGYHSLLFGEPPHIQCFKDEAAECAYLVSEIQRLRATGVPDSHICLVARTREMLTGYAHELERNGLPTEMIHTGRSESTASAGLRLATLHRVKGLEFDFVFVIGANASRLPLASALRDLSDPVAREQAETRERALLYVAATRARKQLFISGYGELSPFLSAQGSQSAS